MNKTTEEFNLAEKMAKRYGVRMCDENGDTHGEELYCVGIDDIADIIREALVDHIADAGKVIAEPVKQEPVCNALTDSEREKYEEKIKGLGNAITRQFNAAEELASRVMELEESMEQEPVFWYRPINEEIYEGPVHNDSVCGKMWRDEKPGEWLPLYAAPVSAKREWVDLTLIELAKAFVGKGSADAGIRAVIAAFKEKNA